MQLYLEHQEQQLFWEIIWEGTTLTKRAGTINSLGEEDSQELPTTSIAFEEYTSQAKAKLEEGYQDPRGKVQTSQLEVKVYENYLQNKEYEAAIEWLAYFGHLEDASLEDQLIDSYIQEKNYAAAEKYVLGKLQGSQDANIVIRQIRYLTSINPMLSRFMMGNLPTTIEPSHAASYYRELAQAHSKIAFFDTLSAQLRVIPTLPLQIIYLTHLLDHPYPDNTQQVLALEKAQLLLKEWESDPATKKEAYQALIARAKSLQQATLATELQLAVQELEKEST